MTAKKQVRNLKYRVIIIIIIIVYTVITKISLIQRIIFITILPPLDALSGKLNALDVFHLLPIFLGTFANLVIYFWKSTPRIKLCFHFVVMGMVKHLAEFVV